MIDRLKQYTLFRNQKIKSFKILENQGHCNENYLLTTKEEKYLIRKFRLPNDRKSEFRVQQFAYKKGVGAEPIILDEMNGLMICRFIEGVHKTKLDKKSLRGVALLIKKLHKIKIRQKPTNLKKNFSFREKKVHLSFVKLQKYKRELVLCHNDLHPQNILFSNSGIKLIDWEYASVNDRYFDIVSIILEHHLNQRDELYFLRAYFGFQKKVNIKKLNAYKIIYKTLWKLWFKKHNINFSD